MRIAVLILAVRIGFQKVGPEILEAGGIDSLRHDVAMSKDLRCGDGDDANAPAKGRRVGGRNASRCLLVEWRVESV